MYEYAIHLAQGNTRRREMMMNKSFYSWGRLHRHNTKEPADRRGWRWLDEWTPVRTSALFWRNLVLIRRSGGLLAIKIYIALTALFGCIIAALRVLKPTADQSGLLALGGTLQFILIFAFVPSSIAWISQTLKRFEIQKPLPIPPKHAVLAELLTPTLAVAGSNLFGMITLSILFPHRWEIFVLGYLTMGSGYMLMSCLLFIVLLFNPDPNDTLQRMLFGIYQLIVFVLAFLPAAVVVGFGFVLHVPPLIQGVVVLLVNAACMYLLVALAAKKYESFNPLE